MNNPGRPTICTKEITEKICERIAAGESLNAICKEPDMPSKSSALLWVVQHREIEDSETGEKFSDKYHEAREAAGYSHADRIISLVERLDPENMNPDNFDPDDTDAIELAKLQRLDHQTAKVMIDGLRWAAERMAPKKHSTRQEIDHTSSDGSMSPKTITATDPQEAAQQYADMMGKSD